MEKDSFCVIDESFFLVFKLVLFDEKNLELAKIEYIIKEQKVFHDIY